MNTTFVNIICPGYKKKREAKVEEFDFKELSDNILECPNVILMLEKMNDYSESIDDKNRRKVTVKTILADVAILNCKELSKRQNVRKIMNKFFFSIKNSGLVHSGENELLKMSELPGEFNRIPLGGIKPSLAREMFKKVEVDIKVKAEEYIEQLVFDRANKIRSKGGNIDKQDLVIQAEKEVRKFVAEYGLAGLAIRKMYKNSIVCFTEPSGYMRGYFYNSFLKKKDRLEVLYLC